MNTFHSRVTATQPDLGPSLHEHEYEYEYMIHDFHEYEYEYLTPNMYSSTRIPSTLAPGLYTAL